jgi:peptidoglycan glycosyltransferase
MSSKKHLLDRLISASWGLCSLLVVGFAAAGDLPTIRFESIEWKDGVATAVGQHGDVIELGLDLDLQTSLTRILTQARPIAGAATLIDARTGQVLAAAEIGDTRGGHLLFDAVAPAASLFKIVTTAALFEHTTVTPMTRVCTQGGARDILREHLSPASGPGISCSRFAHALGVSQNAVYAQLATQKLTRDDLIATAQNLGFGSSTIRERLVRLRSPTTILPLLELQ